MDTEPDSVELHRRVLIALVRDLVRELHPQRSRFIEVAPSSRIERDLGIDSLTRTELILRIERAFHVHLPAQAIGEAETVEDLVRALEQAAPALEPALTAAPVSALPAVPAASEANTLIEVLDWHATQHADRLHLTVLQDEATTLGTLTYGELAARSRQVAFGLIERDVSPGDRVGLMLPTYEFFLAFFGILRAAQSVPFTRQCAFPAQRPFAGASRILRNAGACMLITMPEARPLAGLLHAAVDSLTSVASVADIEAAAIPTILPQLKRGAVALIHSSGSTGVRKASLTHAHLLPPTYARWGRS
jgi:acyl carrier protein